MRVTDEDRAYFARIGAIKGASHASATQSHLSLSLDERLERSWQLYLANREAARERVDDPSPFYERARALGLYRP